MLKMNRRGLISILGVESYHDLVTQYSSSMEEEEQVAHDGGDEVHQQAAHAAEMRCTGGSRRRDPDCLHRDIALLAS